MHKKAETLDLKEDKSRQAGEPFVLSGKVGSHSGEYKKLFGRTFGDGHDSEPWKRGIVRVCGEKKIKIAETGGSKASRKIVIFFVFVDTAKGELRREGRIFIL